MAEAVNKRKKLFQVAKELNLASETIREFLEKKGVAIKNPNMRIPQDVYEMILERFSYEKKEAEKIQKRRDERTREEELALEAAEEKHQQAEKAAEMPDPSVEEEPEELASDAAAEEVAPEVAEEGVNGVVPPAEEAEDSVDTETEAEPEADEDIAEDAAEQENIPDDSIDEPVEEEQSAELARAEPANQEEAVSEEILPQVGDIIDHPMAKRYLERQKEEAERKRRAKEKKTTEGSGAAKTDDKPVSDADRKDRKKDRKKDRRETQEEKDARRRKAIEMVRKEGKKIRPQMVVPEEEQEGAVAKDGRRKRKKKKSVDQKEVETSLRKTLAEMSDSGSGKKRRKKVRAADGEETEIEAEVITVTEFITTQDLASLLDVIPSEIIRKCLELGLVVTINQRLDMDTIKLLAEEFEVEVKEAEEFGTEFLEEIHEEEDAEEDLIPRPPVVTIMGHVDHGKTSLLDYIRSANVVGGESGGITQHIGAYEVELEDGRQVTFLDTPGHEAFTAMRARGAQVTDIVVLVIAADDRVMPQTEEALDHAKAAGVPIIIALNKVDRPSANPESIRQQLAEKNILVEDWGGKYQCVEVSAKTGANVGELLEKILLEAEILDLKANPKRRAKGVVLEAQLDKGKGPVATVLIQAGTLKPGDSFIAGQNAGRIRALINERGQRVDHAGPSTPVQILGVEGVPEAGDKMMVMEDDKVVREIAQRRQQLKREQDFRQVKLITLDQISEQIKQGRVQELKLLVKADVDGSAQALADSLLKLSTDTVEVQVIRKAVGPIVESDIILAAASHAIIIGFHVRPTTQAKELADAEHVDIRLYKVIYDAIEDVEKALEGMLEPIAREVVTGTVEIREIFKISRIGTIGGCYVTSGKINRNSSVRLIRNEVEIYDGKLSSLKRFKEDVREVQSGYECGLTIENYNDIKVGDLVEAYEVIMEAQTLKRA